MDGTLTATGAGRRHAHLWTFSTTGSPIESSPLVVGDELYFGAWNGRSTPSTSAPASRAGPSRPPGDDQGQRRPGRRPRGGGRLRRAGARPGRPAPAPSGWTYRGGVRFYGGPGVSGDTIVIGDVGGAVIALDARDGCGAVAPLHRRRVRLLQPGDRRRHRLHRLLRRPLPGPRPRRRRRCAGPSTWAGAISGSATVVDGVVYTAAPLRPGPGPRAPTGSTRHRRGALREIDDGPLLARGRRRAHPLPRGHPDPPCLSRARAVGASGSGLGRAGAGPVAAGVLGVGLVAGLVRLRQRRGHDRGLRAGRGARAGARRRRPGRSTATTRAAPAPTRRSTCRRPSGGAGPTTPARCSSSRRCSADGRAVVGTNAGLGARRSTSRPGASCGAPICAGGSRRPRRWPATWPCSRPRGAAWWPSTRPPGAQVWRRSLGSASSSRRPSWSAARPTWATLSGRVVRLDVRTGGVRWTAQAAGDVKASLALTGPNVVVVGDYAGHVTAFRRSRRPGGLAHDEPGRAPAGPGRFYAGPAVAYGRVYVGNVNGRVRGPRRGHRRGRLGARARRLRLLERGRGRPDRSTWAATTTTCTRSTPSPAACGGAFDAGERISGSPSVIGDLVYVSTLARDPPTGRTFALDARTGRRVLDLPRRALQPGGGDRRAARADRRAHALRPDAPADDRRPRLARAAAIVALFGLVSRLLGFVREVVLRGARTAPRRQADAFVNSPADRQHGRRDAALHAGDPGHPGLPARARGRRRGQRVAAHLRPWPSGSASC